MEIKIQNSSGRKVSVNVYILLSMLHEHEVKKIYTSAKLISDEIKKAISIYNTIINSGQIDDLHVQEGQLNEYQVQAGVRFVRDNEDNMLSDNEDSPEEDTKDLLVDSSEDIVETIKDIDTEKPKTKSKKGFFSKK